MILLKVLKTLLKYLFLFLSGIIVYSLILPVLWSPVYDFPESTPFQGDHFYNPYEGMKKDQWKKGNFQIQSHAWGGVTNGSTVTSKDVYDVYSSLKYDIITISDYMSINDYNKNNPEYIPVYEHGYSVFKAHQVLVGAKNVTWFDYPLFQTLNNKQYILNKLHSTSELIAIAHPGLLNGYSLDEMKYLTNYDVMEVLNHLWFSLGHWDAALSAGKPVFIMANDDAHNLVNPFLYGVVCTMVNTPLVNQKNVVECLKSGMAYGYVPVTPYEETYEKKQSRVKNHSYLTGFDLKGNDLTISTSHRLHKVTFIGQGGDTLKDVNLFSENTKEVSYKIADNDTYVRTEIIISNGDKLYLNPIFRIEGNEPVRNMASLNLTKTIIYRGIAFLILFGLFWKWGRWRKSRLKK